MSDQLVLIDREALLAELQQAFDPRTAEVLLGVLDKVAAQVRAAGITREDFTELKQIVTNLAVAQQRTEQSINELRHIVMELAAAQQRTEQRITESEARLTRVEAAIERLVEAQRRTEQRITESEARLTRVEAAIERLAEAQRRTEQRVAESEGRLTRVEAAIERLAEAQRRTEQRVEELAAAQQRFEQHFEQRFNELDFAMGRLQRQVGGLSETVGGDIEDIAYIVLYDVLKREFGWQVGVLERSWQTWDGTPEEVDVFGTAVDPTRPDTTIWIVGEAKHNLSAREVERFALQVVRARQHLRGEIFPVCFCYRARPEVQQMIKDAGLRLVFSYGKLV